MTSYRFCRPDDMHLLVHAINRCYVPHFEEIEDYTADNYKLAVRELNLWASSCMIAHTGVDEDVVAVSIGCKRDTESYVFMVGCQPGETGNGHIGHMLESLRRKMAILGPPDIVAELPEQNVGVNRLFDTSGYTNEDSLVDFKWNRDTSSNSAHSIPIDSITLADVVELGMFNTELSRSWIRQLKTLENCARKIGGCAIVSAEGVECYLLYKTNESDASVEIRALGKSERSSSESALIALLRTFCSQQQRDVVVPKLSASEMPYEVLEQAGFVPTARYARVRITALPE